MTVKGLEECAEGATVTLFNGIGETISECKTDNYGDFKFDNLAENSGKYRVRIAHQGYAAKDIEVALKKSVNIGVIHL